MRSVPEYLEIHGQEDGHGVQCGARFISYALLNSIAKRNANALRAYGVQKQNVGVVVDGNSLEYIVAYWSLLLTENTIVPLARRGGFERIQKDAEWCDVNWIMYLRDEADLGCDIIGGSGFGLLCIDDGFQIRFVREPGRSVCRENDVDIALILQTSGTSGAPKRAMIAHRNLVANTFNSLATLPLTQSDSCLVVFPLHSITGNSTQLLVHTAIGSDIVLYDKPIFFAGRFCELVEERKIAVFNCTPAHLSLLGRFSYLDRAKLSSLRYVASSGTALPACVLDRCMEVLPAIPIVQMYGLTECSPRATILDPRDYKRHKGSCGRSIQGITLKIIDDNGHPVNSGTVGEVVLRGENVFPGYYKNEEASAATLKDGWLHTGDLGYLCGEGYLYLVGRKKNVLNVNGAKVSAEEIEALILEHRSVGDVRVRAEVDSLLGDIVVADVVLCEPGKAALDNIESVFRGRLPMGQWPRKFYMVDTIEKTFTGKTRRF